MLSERKKDQGSLGGAAGLGGFGCIPAIHFAVFRLPLACLNRTEFDVVMFVLFLTGSRLGPKGWRPSGRNLVFFPRQNL